MPGRTTLLTCLILAPVLRAQSVAESAEPNASPATATVLACAHQGEGHISPGDADAWRFDLSMASDVAIHVTSRGARPAALGGTSAEDLLLELYEIDGVTLIARNDDDRSRAPSACGFFPSLTDLTLPAGSYLARIRGYDALEFGDYSIDLVCSSPTTPAPGCATLSIGSGEIEPNDTQATATPLAACTIQFGALATASDRDVWRLDILSDSEVTLDLEPDPTQPSPLVFGAVRLQDPVSGETLAVDVANGAASASVLQSLRPGTYFVEVTAGAGSPGHYRLVCNQRLSPGLADVAVDLDSAACVGSSGVPLRWALRKNEWPRVGSTFGLDIAGAPPVVVVLAEFFVPTNPPIDLAILGAPGCRLLVTFGFEPIQAVATTAGEAEFSFLVEPGSNALGLVVYLQAAGLDVGANGLGVVFSDRATLTIHADA